MKIHRLLIPLGTVIVATIGSYFTNLGLAKWYTTITLPTWTPPGYIIGIVWTTIFILTALSAIIAWEREKAPARSTTLAWFIINGIMNVLWCYIFFKEHLLQEAVLEAIFLEITVLILIARLWKRTRTAACLLFPYAAWVGFAGFLTYAIASLNP